VWELEGPIIIGPMMSNTFIFCFPFSDIRFDSLMPSGKI